MTKQILIRNTHENMTPIIRSILVSLDSETETIITFEKDEYHFYKDGSLHQMSYASGSLSAENDTIAGYYTSADAMNTVAVILAIYNSSHTTITHHLVSTILTIFVLSNSKRDLERSRATQQHGCLICWGHPNPRIST